MKKIGPFIPIAGLFLLLYYQLSGEETGIEIFGKKYYEFVAIQALSVDLIILIFFKERIIEFLISIS